MVLWEKSVKNSGRWSKITEPGHEPWPRQTRLQTCTLADSCAPNIKLRGEGNREKQSVCKLEGGDRLVSALSVVQNKSNHHTYIIQNPNSFKRSDESRSSTTFV
jgi:hypothetical protein